MGDVIKNYFVKSKEKEKPNLFSFYFDTGSPRTFVKESKVKNMIGLSKLPSPYKFSGLGNGSFYATHSLHIQVRLLGIWVPHFCYVVSDEVLDDDYDVLLGHDFMQIYDITLKPREKKVIIKKEALRRALKVREIY